MYMYMCSYCHPSLLHISSEFTATAKFYNFINDRHIFSFYKRTNNFSSWMYLSYGLPPLIYLVETHVTLSL